ncbi:MAG: response regulator [Pseudomonadota bacterium]
MPDDDFLRRLRATFLVEAREHLQAMSSGLLQLEQASPPQRAPLVQNVFRAAHSLKGAAGAVELGDIESLCQLLEDCFAAWRENPAVPPAGVMDVLHRALDTMGAMLLPLAGAPARVTPAEIAALRKELRRLGLGGPAPGTRSAGVPLQATPAAGAAPPVAGPPFAMVPPPASLSAPVPAPLAASGGGGATAAETLPEDTVRVALPKLALQLLGAEEMLAAKLAAGQRVADLRSFTDWLAEWRKAWALIEPRARRLREGQAVPDGSAAPAALASDLARMLDFCDWSGDAVRAMEGRLHDIGRATRHDRDAVGKLVDDLLDTTKKLLLLPFSTITAAFPRLVRDLCRDQGKEAELRIEGEHVEIDKRILEEMKDPIVHMLRNAVDHAVELPALRLQRGKPVRATITLALSQVEGNRVQLLLSDDGAGVAVAQLKAEALRRGLASAEELGQMDEAAALALAFRPELSTSVEVTQLSGRGLGLAIVQERAQRLGGEVRLESRPGAGTTLRVLLPATRATFRGILCDVAGQQLLVPTTAVERVARVRRDEVATVEGRETVALGGRVVALVRLADVLDLDPVAPGDPAWLQVVLVGTGEQAVAFVVDGVLEEQEVLVKPLRRPLCRVRNIAAAGVLGSGQVVPILRVADLLRSARHAVPRKAPDGPSGSGTARTARSILLAEDSITSRMLLKTILESAGYAVKTAVDGLEAYALLRTEPFDLLVSDVEMPRLNGFDLTVRVRADKKLAELPVVLVTALSTREDREHGIDVGANAYITKGGFDQNELIEAIERLVH